jgi:hypothetical protein
MTGRAVDSMKIENLLTGAFLLGGTTLLARALSQSFEQALLTTVMEWTIGRAKAMRRLLR